MVDQLDTGVSGIPEYAQSIGVQLEEAALALDQVLAIE